MTTLRIAVNVTIVLATLLVAWRQDSEHRAWLVAIAGTWVVMAVGLAMVLSA